MTLTSIERTAPCCICARPGQRLIEVRLGTSTPPSFAHICRTCYELVEPGAAYPHPETCQCRGTMCRHVEGVMINDPCEEEQHDEDPHPDRIARQELRDYEEGR